MGKLQTNFLLVVLVAVATSPCAADEALDTAPIIAALIEVTADADAAVRYAAFDALESQPPSDVILDLCWRGLDDDFVEIRRLCLNKVVRLEGPTVRVLTRLISLMEKRTNADETQLAKVARSHLITIGTPAIPYLLESIKKDDTNGYAVSVLGEIPLGENRTTVATQLSALLKSENSEIKRAAVKSLHQIMIADADAKAAQAKVEAKASAEPAGIDTRYLAYYTKMIEKYDTNADGSLNKDEWSKMSKDPAAADTDQDGKITAAELAKWSMPPRQQGN